MQPPGDYMTPAATGSIDARMIATNNRASGFDYLRLILSTAVILWHSCVLSYGKVGEDQLSELLRIPARSILICFFALSGFLVAGSLWRCRTLFSFLGLRVIRIIPALFLEVTISALILGPLVTTSSFTDYIAAPEFKAYFLNILGLIHYFLPGVFTSNPFPNVVNGQLWTIPWELKCYVALCMLALFKIINRKIGFAVVLALLQCYFIAKGFKQTDPSQDFMNGNNMVMAFLYGVAFNVYRKEIPYSKYGFAIAVLLSVLLLALPKGGYFAPLPLTYLIVYVGLLNPRKLLVVSSGDYSYGLYLYGFPFQQLIASLGPNFHHWAINFALSFGCALCVAYFSWNYIELPSSKLRPRLLALENEYIRLRNFTFRIKQS